VLIEKATRFAALKHAGHKRKYTDAPYLTHLLAVADLVRSTGASDTVIAAAILHDTLEDTETTLKELKTEFGSEVASLVLEVTDVYTDHAAGNRAARKGWERDRLSTVSADAMTIKVADIIDNTGSIAERDPGFAKMYRPEKAAMLKILIKAHPALLAKASAMLG